MIPFFLAAPQPPPPLCVCLPACLLSGKAASAGSNGEVEVGPPYRLSHPCRLLGTCRKNAPSQPLAAEFPPQSKTRWRSAGRLDALLCSAPHSPCPSSVKLPFREMQDGRVAVSPPNANDLFVRSSVRLLPSFLPCVLLRSLSSPLPTDRSFVCTPAHSFQGCVNSRPGTPSPANTRNLGSGFFK